MSIVTGLNAYLGACIALPFAATLLCALRALNSKLRLPFTQRQLLLVAYALVVASLLAPLSAASLIEGGAMLPPAVQVWSGSSLHVATEVASTVVITGAGGAPGATAMSQWALLVTAAFAAGLAWMLLRLAIDLWRVQRLAAAAHTLRKQGHARVLVSDSVQVPFSSWTPGRNLVFMPVSWLHAPADLRMALRHEAQHHRQLDTRLVYALQALRAMFWWNPGVRWCVRQVLELQEFACDEAASGLTAARREAYCRCLLRAGNDAVGAAPLAAACITGQARTALVRRVQAALHPPSASRDQGAVVALIALVTLAIGATSLAISSPIHDRRIDLAEAQRMATVARRDSSFPIVVNEAVLAQLNALLGTPDGREFLRASMARMSLHQSYIESQLARHELPRELLAVPLVESGYRNRVAGIGGGLWMFIVPTARRFGLQVSESRDERLDIVRETDAAMRMLGGLRQQFGDWPLALLAYNRGDAYVTRRMRDAGSTDAFALVAERDANAAYLPRVMAAVLILANPGMVE